MHITVERDTFTDRSTTGRLLVDGKFQCFTLEDVVRPVKIKGITAIPAGMYEVVVSFSARFQRLLPLLLAVPNFDGVRIHTGNTDADTEGCLLVGRTRSADFVSESRAAFAPLFAVIQAAVQREKVFIEIAERRRGALRQRPPAPSARRAATRAPARARKSAGAAKVSAAPPARSAHQTKRAS